MRALATHRLGAAYRVELRRLHSGALVLVVTRTADGSSAGESDVTRQTPAELRALADALDLAWGWLPPGDGFGDRGR